jgi:RimJ/RimL family protein N-acetyltransferase
MAPPTITTERLVLRPFTYDDLEALAVIHSEESFWWYPLRGGMDLEQTTAFLARNIDRYQTDGLSIEALTDRESGELIGWAGLAVPHFLPEILPCVEVGWRLAGAWRGRGLATEIGRASVDWGFTAGGLDRLVSIYEPENVASGHVMEKLGFVPYLTTTGEQHGRTVLVTELTRDRWEERRAGG